MIQDAIVKAISQMGDNIYQSFKVTKIEPTKGEYRDQEYVIVNFKYALLTLDWRCSLGYQRGQCRGGLVELYMQEEV
jgi:hypothetical protein